MPLPINKHVSSYQLFCIIQNFKPAGFHWTRAWGTDQCTDRGITNWVTFKPLSLFLDKLAYSHYNTDLSWKLHHSVCIGVGLGMANETE